MGKPSKQTINIFLVADANGKETIMEIAMEYQNVSAKINIKLRIYLEQSQYVCNEKLVLFSKAYRSSFWQFLGE